MSGDVPEGGYVLDVDLDCPICGEVLHGGTCGERQ
jgi:hypothetical protein